MQSKAKTIKEYLDEVPDDRKAILSEMHKTIVRKMPKGFQEVMSYGMIGYVVPHSLYPAGYHCDPKLPLPFMCLASQKNYISFYHMGLYAGLLLEWFTGEWPKHSTKKLDMGKCCIRFKKPEDVPLKLIAELASKMTPQEWISVYEKAFKKK
ncbi:MAG: DUF1801 domain-containing protein [Saprospiraceae bacterium]|nr:DUF1801 domain-containing protein [Saprospiraceae bacterium]